MISKGAPHLRVVGLPGGGERPEARISPTSSYTLLLTDLVDSTAMVDALGDARAAEIWARHDRMARDLLAESGGREIDKSDGFLLLFEEAEAGVRYALAYHAGLRRLTSELGVRLSARAGLHTGPVHVRANSEEDIARGAKRWEVEGLAKPLAARLMGLSMGGQTLISRDTLQAAGPLGDLATVCHGHYRLKGIAEPVEVHEVGPKGTPLRPPPDAAKAYRVVRDEHGWRPARELPGKESGRG